jgi:hypothetical protein
MTIASTGDPPMMVEMRKNTGSDQVSFQQTDHLALSECRGKDLQLLQMPAENVSYPKIFMGTGFKVRNLVTKPGPYLAIL